MANKDYTLYPHSDGHFLVVAPDGTEKKFKTRDGATKWVANHRKKNKPKPEDPTKGMNEDQKRLYRLQNQIGDPESLALDSSMVYKKNLPQYTPARKSFVKSPLDKSQEYEDWLKEVNKIDPVKIASDLQKIEDELEEKKDTKKYATLRRSLKKRKAELEGILLDYEQSKKLKTRPKVDY
jgi:hypothetical protein